MILRRHFYFIDMKNEIKEVWVGIKDFESSYEISSFGIPRSLNRLSINRNKVCNLKGKILKKVIRNGYEHIMISSGNLRFVKKVHRLVAEAFIPNPENKRCVNHKDGNKLNNHVSNLEWVTHSENNKHAYDFNLKKPIIGKKVFTCKLYEKEVLEIRASNLTAYKLAKLFCVSKSNIASILHRKSWKHI